MRASVHINTYTIPKAIVIDGSSAEEEFFTTAMRQEAEILKLALIEIPRDGAKRLGWMTKLDGAALSGKSQSDREGSQLLIVSAAWSRISLDILVHASQGASGSLIRLLKSLSAADFTASSVPHLTIELPHEIDSPTAAYLEAYQWPPSHVPNPSNVRQLSLRRRIPRHGVNEEESSARFLESFWPAHPTHSHVLVLSPQAELSPNFFHCKLALCHGIWGQD